MSQLLRERSPVLYDWLPHTCDTELTAHVMWYTHTMRSAPPHTCAHTRTTRRPPLQSSPQKEQKPHQRREWKQLAVGEARCALLTMAGKPPMR